MQYTLLADGRSDKVLVHIINWVLDEKNIFYTPQVAEWLQENTLHGRCREAVLKYPCDVLFVHRDAEARKPEERHDEIRDALASYVGNSVHVVPVRMTEAWLLSSENAIRTAARNRNGSVKLELPNWRQWDRLSDPKNTLATLLRTATELPARRLRKFSVERARYRVAELTVDFSPLRQLSAFRQFEKSIETILKNLAA